MLREIGLGTEVHAYVADARVFAIDGVDPTRFVVMRGGEALDFAPTLFASRGASSMPPPITISARSTWSCVRTCACWHCDHEVPRGADTPAARARGLIGPKP